jgi:predicted TIM-barrel fold metal-dependent hydrolase
MKNPRLVIEDMDRLRIEMSVLSSATVIEPTSWAEPSVELELVRRLNDTIAEWAAHSPRRIIGSFVLPLQDMDLALQEITRAVGLGLKVANIPSEMRGTISETASFGRSGRRRRTSVWCPSCTRKVGNAHGFSNSACGTRSLNR